MNLIEKIYNELCISLNESFNVNGLDRIKLKRKKDELVLLGKLYRKINKYVVIRYGDVIDIN